ncbi:MAG: hypothetical protein Q7T88_09395 [Methylotenera sp.]|nr:hypothetical protein [Methylotenera sp.]
MKISYMSLYQSLSQYCSLNRIVFNVSWLTFVLLAAPAVHAAGYNYATSASLEARPTRDPFTTSDRMYGEVGNQSAQRAGSGMGFVPGYGAQAAPKMRLKGFVTKGNKKAAALLEVEGAGVYLVSEGDEIGLQALGQNSVLKIIKVDVNGVRVQSGQVNQVIVVR